MKTLTDKQREGVQKTLLKWYREMGRHDLPWRKTSSLYCIAVSEIMLQQTNVPKVIGKYADFLDRFPTVEVLASARQSDVLKMWQGLGYNRRAINLYKMAQCIVDDYDGKFPESIDALGDLPGIGPYTRAAILAFGRNADVSAVDVNIDRFVRRLHGLRVWDKKLSEKIIAQYVPQGKSRDWHGGVMDFASVICTKRKPKCLQCPFNKVCKSYPDPDDYTVIKKREVGRTECGKHIPRRIYRGRIVEVLRKQPYTANEIGQHVKKDWNAQHDKKWLDDILKTLQKEEMIIENENRKQWQLQ